MTHLKIFFLLIVCALSVLDGKAQTGIALADELNGKRIGVIGDSYVRNHKEPFENTWHYKFAKKHGMEYFNYGKNGNSIAYSARDGEKRCICDMRRWRIASIMSLSLADIMMHLNWTLSEVLITSKIKWKFCAKA